MKRFFWAYLFSAGLSLVGCTDKKEHSPKEAHPKNTSAQTASKSYDTIITKEFYHDELSNSFDIKVLVKRFADLKEQHDSCVAKFTIFDKNKMAKDSFSLTSNFFYSILEDPKEVRSYTTKFNINKQVVDNIYGDIVVADFNFDKKDDIAILSDTGGTSGPLYSFYLQGENMKFKLDKFLTDSMAYFPDEIKNNQLQTSVVGGVCYLGRHTYVFDKKKSSWVEKSHITIDICKNKVVKKSE